MPNELLHHTKERMSNTEANLRREFGFIRAGRANASLLDRIMVDYYGAPTPLNQLATVSIPEARLFILTPFDKGSIKDIERAINASDLGLTPQTDGNMIRLVLPQLTEERRAELAKDVKKVGENAKVAIRNIRRDSIEAARKKEKDGDITEDGLRGLEHDIQGVTDKSIKEIDRLTKDKEKELKGE